MPCLFALLTLSLLSDIHVFAKNLEEGIKERTPNNHEAKDSVHHAFVQTGSELHYFRDVWHQEIMLSSISESGEK